MPIVLILRSIRLIVIYPVKIHKKPQKSDTIWSLGGKALGAADSDTSVSFKQRAEAYLLSIGVSQKDIDDLRTLMLE